MSQDCSWPGELAGSMNADRLIGALSSGEVSGLRWLRRRVQYRAAARFSSWAWNWIKEDFLADLTVQLTVTMARPGFSLQGPIGAYVDRAISNLCNRYFLRIAQMRRNEPLEPEASRLPSESKLSLESLAAALNVRRALWSVSPACRSLLIQKYVEGLSLRELAEKAGIEAKTVQSRLQTCRGKLRHALTRLTRQKIVARKTQERDSPSMET